MTSYHFYPPQNADEFEGMCQLVRELGPRHILEVGSRHGRSLVRLCEAAMPSLDEVTVIDLPDSVWGQSHSKHSLRACCAALEARGVKVGMHLIDSHGDEAERLAEQLRDVDFIFLDGDHTEAGVRADFARFSPCLSLRGVIALHDIAGSTRATSRGARMGVPVVWPELAATPGWYVRTLIKKRANFGIGMLSKTSESLLFGRDPGFLVD